MNEESLLAGLNEAQQKAISADFGPIMVLAGPGSGKTRVLTHRIAHLVAVKKLPSWQIMAVTFTNKAAKEMRERVARIIGETANEMMIGTFHATCARWLRRETNALIELGYSADFVIFDADDQKAVIKQALKELNLDEKKFTPQMMQSHISAAKDKSLTPQLYSSQDYIGTVVKRVYERYQATLLANNAMDFDDLLLNTVLLFERRPDVLEKYQTRYRYLLVDEFQDTNAVQYKLLLQIAAQHRNIFIVGDADQSIYKWRGADVLNMQRFREQFSDAEEILLEQNYRSSQTILDVAMSVIQRNADRVHKQLFTQRGHGRPITIREAYNEAEEGLYIVETIRKLKQQGHDGGDFAVMYRTNAQSRAIEEAFVRAGMAYRLVGAQKFYGRREVKDVIAYLRLTHNLSDEVSLRRIINVPRRKIGEKTLEQLFSWSKEIGRQAGEALVELARQPNQNSPFTGATLASLKKFGEQLSHWHNQRDQLAVGQLFDLILQETEFKGYLHDGTEEGEDRWANVLELRAVAMAAGDTTLAEFLEQVALVADADTVETGSDVPTLLTLHASKGLEFPIVFITGLEDGLLPHSRTFENRDEMAEERRLFYVGITRAQDRLYLLHSFRRSSYGMTENTNPSRFLLDIPSELVEGGNRLSNRKKEADERMAKWQWNQQETMASKPSAPSRSYGSQGSGASYQAQTPRGSRNRPTEQPTKPSVTALPSRQPSAEEPERTSPVTQKHQLGQKVRHHKFGEGVVLESKLVGKDEEVTVAFKGAEVGIKKLVASFAKLEVLG